MSGEIFVGERAGREGLLAPLALLEEFLRPGEPLPEEFVRSVVGLVEGGDFIVFAAEVGGRVCGVLTLALRPSFAIGGYFGSIEDLYVLSEYRRTEVGRAMISAAETACRERDISYVEVQAEEPEAREFYASVGYEPEGEVRVMSRSLPVPRNDRN